MRKERTIGKNDLKERYMNPRELVNGEKYHRILMNHKMGLILKGEHIVKLIKSQQIRWYGYIHRDRRNHHYARFGRKKIVGEIAKHTLKCERNLYGYFDIIFTSEMHITTRNMHFRNNELMRFIIERICLEKELFNPFV